MIKSKHVLTVAAAIMIASASAATTVSIGGTGGTGNPDCSGAAASLGSIWPPNHTMIGLNIVGVTDDPSVMPLSIVVTSIMQDELVAAIGSGKTSPDGSGVGTSTAMVRAERAGPGTGRIYFISFSATNKIGGQCTGTVNVFVPHDQGQGFTPVDTLQRYDSTQTYF